MFKMRVLQALYNRSDDPTGFQARDRLSFQRCLGLSPENTLPSAKAPWLCRDQLARPRLTDKRLPRFEEPPWASRLRPKGGQIIGAWRVSVPKHRSTRDESKPSNDGKTPTGTDDQPHRKRQKDEDARWTRQHGKGHSGYKHHIKLDTEPKRIRRCRVTDARVHDSQAFDAVTAAQNRGRWVWADSAYRAAARAGQRREPVYESRIPRKGSRRASNQEEQAANHRRSGIRAAVPHVVGDQRTCQHRILVRTPGKARAAVKIGLRNLTSHMRRPALLLRPQSAWRAACAHGKPSRAVGGAERGEKPRRRTWRTTINMVKRDPVALVMPLPASALNNEGVR